MIKRIYIDNFRGFVNFEWKPSSLNLMLGDNGSGKTSIFDVLGLLQKTILGGTPTNQCFLRQSVTAWEKRLTQTFEVDIKGNGGVYRYRLEIRYHQSESEKNWIQAETVTFNDQPLYTFDSSEVSLYRDDFTGGAAFPFDPSRSALATIPDRDDNAKLTWFRDHWHQIFTFSPDPLRMLAMADKEVARPDRQMRQIVAWLRHLTQDSFESINTLREYLADALHGFSDFRLSKAGENARVLKLLFSYGSGTEIPFDWLSDGQRTLFSLYAILAAAVGPGRTVCIDEPDNFVALRELQPWLTELRDRVEDSGGQVLMISHNSEVIDYLASGDATEFYRDDSGPMRCRPFAADAKGGFKPSELISRDWVQA